MGWITDNQYRQFINIIIIKGTFNNLLHIDLGVVNNFNPLQIAMGNLLNFFYLMNLRR